MIASPTAARRATYRQLNSEGSTHGLLLAFGSQLGLRAPSLVAVRRGGSPDNPLGGRGSSGETHPGPNPTNTSAGVGVPSRLFYHACARVRARCHRLTFEAGPGHQAPAR